VNGFDKSIDQTKCEVASTPTPASAPTSGEPSDEQSADQSASTSDEQSRLSETSVIIAQAVTATGVAAILSVSIATMSSPIGAFSMINQFQFYIILPMIGAYMPKSVIKFILGMEFVTLALSFVPIDKIPVVNKIKDIFSYAQDNDYYNEIGMESGSAIANNLTLLLFVFLFLILHALFIPIHLKIMKSVENRCVKWTSDKLFRFMTLTLYIRLFMEAYLFLLVCTISEINRFDTDEPVTIGSLSVAFVLAI
jgi:hypothetical protein